MIAVLFAFWLLSLALSATVRVGPTKIPAQVLGFWWLGSFVGQMLAAPMVLVAAIAAILLSGTIAKVAAALAALLFAVAHLRNRRDGATMLRAMGLDEALPLGAGFRPMSSRAGTRRISRIAYAPDGERTTLDIVAPAERPAAAMPVLIHIHGGAWLLGKRNQQAKPLLHHLARNGWLCLDINYRLAPKHRFPTMLTDVLRAIVWAKANVAQYGGDPARIALTGGSAGGHLTALGALAHDRAAAKPGFENEDCSVQAAVPNYGRFDFTDRLNLWGRNHASLRQWEADKIMPADVDSAGWNLASPIALVRADAPPMLVIHGAHDTLIPVAEGAAFAMAQRDAGGSVDHIELSGGQHAFDTMESALTWAHVRAVRAWLERHL
ncbi:alpha/beta hydrolase [Novosphingobium sp. Gsoil 351]|uniref:alpha/beta hydrolase n=1 Tax=Novosphingobium sp. Gsoil 351 TaxID=2675225 RepID=UPI0018A80759|nr:alpha/beta hydrolase [Novosphingobium sp. Gsoil 351]